MEGGATSGSISIRKKSRHSDGGSEGRQGDRDAPPPPRAAAGAHHTDVLSQRAMADLKSYLGKKGFGSRAEEFSIHIRQKGGGDGSYSVQYTDAKGEVYTTKGELLASLDKPAPKERAAPQVGAVCLSCMHSSVK
jgi:hypothetical protein